MRTMRRFWQVAALVLALLVLGAIPTAAQGPDAQTPELYIPHVVGSLSVGEAAAKKPAADDKLNRNEDRQVERFLHVLDRGGFAYEEGDFVYLDLVKAACTGNAPTTLANNPWPNAYVVLSLKPVPGQPPFPYPFPFQLRQDEAVVMIGQTPPPSMFFSYQTFVGMLPGSEQFLMVPYGDSINIGTIHTIGPDKFNRPFVYILTGNRTMEQRMRAAVLAAGYPAAIINVEAVSPIIGPLGYGAEGSMLLMGHRVAGVESEDALRKYITETVDDYAVYRVTPNVPLPTDPEPVPMLRVRGTGHTEMELYPALKELRQAILDEQGSLGMQEKEPSLDTHIWTVYNDNFPQDQKPILLVEKPYAGLQRGVAPLGATRDTNYLGTHPNFLMGADEYVIVYGANHQKTGKVTYSSFSIYADAKLWIGVQTKMSRDFGDSARRYLCQDANAPYCQNADLFYAWKVAHDCKGEDYCLEVKYEFEDIDGTTYTCDPDEDGNPLDLNTADLFFLFRSYMEPSTKISPDDNELLYDQAILFTPKP